MRSFAAQSSTLPALNDHNTDLPPDVVTTLSINFEWRRLVSNTLQDYADSIIRFLPDADVDDFRNKFQVLLDDLYSVDIPLAEQYRQRVMATSPLRFNRMNEGAFSVLLDSSGNAYTGTYQGVTWDTVLTPFGEPSPFYDGVNDVSNLYSTAFATAFNPNEMTITIWLKWNSGAWSDGTFRVPIALLRDGNNLMRLIKSTTTGQLSLERTGNGTAKSINATGQSSYDWECWQASVSVAGGGLLAPGEMKFFKNGVQIGATSTGNLAWSGSGLASNNNVIGGGNGTPVIPYHGRIMNVIFHNRAIDNDILALSSIRG